nr:immunoglobulin heavy chain junction region [Macaca mulatta]MOV35849.1 immunoglobulin heavy chain junction region [Macaca mulatta]MOV36184.1 immunoglobulin heavy chain junction region [Macaca mulatta]MOV36355.1 immunoglobulin heavy chain junction region [Macaca mulatta]MOV36528.1 immunoglobulin heavy chain junction region [Macaca mulatta]
CATDALGSGFDFW